MRDEIIDNEFHISFSDAKMVLLVICQAKDILLSTF